MRRLQCIFILFFFLPTNTQANVVGSEFQTFNPTTDGLGYVTVESSEFHKPGHFNLGVFFDYASQVLPQLNIENQSPNDSRTAMNLHGAVGITKYWSFGLSLTNLIMADSNDQAIASGWMSTGREAFRFDTKVRLMRTEKAGVAIQAGLNSDNIDNNPYLGTSPGPTLFINALYERYSSERLRWAINLGYKHRNTGDPLVGSLIQPITGQIFYSAGLNYLTEAWKVHWMAELYGSSPSNSPNHPVDRDLSNLELLLGAKKQVFKKMDAHVGVTRGLTDGFFTPEFRFYVGLNWYFAPPRMGGSMDTELGGKVPGYEFNDTDSDDDGVPDRDDYCPDTPKDRLVDRRGCPLANDLEARDDDFDGVDNIDDECPGTPPGQNVDEVGCPAPEGYRAEVATLDTDLDGVFDDYDLCPDTPQGVQVSERGCEPKKIKKIDLGNLNFITGTAKLTKKSRQRFMQKIDELYKIRKNIKLVVIEGHTDSVGSRKYNQGLSQKRAATIKRILVKQSKIPSKKVKAVGYGEDRPIRSNKTQRGRLLNRRVEMNVISN
jgi:outer membrane protein OmpA-like peptidoglycan-associated protein